MASRWDRTRSLTRGIDRTLDLIAGTAAINAVMPYSHAYNAGLIKALRDRADHGVPLTDNTGRRLALVWGADARSLLQRHVAATSGRNA